MGRRESGPRPATRRPAIGRRAVVLLSVAVLLVLSGVLLLVNLRPGSGRQTSVGGYDWAAPQRHSVASDRLNVGITHTQNSIDPWGDDKAVASARAVLTATSTYQDQALFGWGVLNPEPSPGVYDWSSLDQRMRLIRSTGGTPVITLCCAPDWMKGGQPGETDWNRLEVPPLPEHYADFAKLAVAAEKRYPDVRHFLVWNELKGFWNDADNRWDYEDYTRFYNTVYDALKAADPQVAVGGPYVVVDTWAGRDAGGHPSGLSGTCGTVDQRGLDVLDYWLRDKHGADFVVVDASAVTRDLGPPPATGVADSAVFGAITRWLRGRTNLPIWWSEFHVGQGDPANQPQLVASAVAGLLYMADEGASAALYWQPQLDLEDAHGVHAPGLWTSTEVAGGGKPLPLAEAMAWMQHVLADSADNLVSWPVPEVGVLNGRHDILAVNTAGHQTTVRVRDVDLTLGPYEVRHVRLPAGAPPAPPGSWHPGVDQCLHGLSQPQQ